MLTLKKKNPTTHLPSEQVHRPHWCGFLSSSWRWHLYSNLFLPVPPPHPPCRWLPGRARMKRFASSPPVACTYWAYRCLAPAQQGLNDPTKPYTRSRPHTSDPDELEKERRRIRVKIRHIIHPKSSGSFLVNILINKWTKLGLRYRSFKVWVTKPVMQPCRVLLLQSP